jgi:cellulose synthase/poly-beta-1,6-N-acetylglucosamine synthase-like glycosyltransferase
MWENITYLYLISQWIFLLYLLGLTAGYLMLDIIAVLHLRRYMEERSLESLPHGYTSFEPQISLLVPAYNEEATIASSIRSQLQLSYSEYEIIAINDGSKDKTLEVLIKEFALVPFPEAYDRQLATKAIRTITIPRSFPTCG